MMMRALISHLLRVESVHFEGFSFLSLEGTFWRIFCEGVFFYVGFFEWFIYNIAQILNMFTLS